MLINQELAQEFKEAVKKLYNQFSLKYHAGYPKAFQSLLKLQAFYSSSSVDLDVLNKLLLEAKEVLAGGDAFRITTAYYADLTKAIDLIIDRFTHKKTRLEASLQQVVTPPTETS
ncbi:MAG: hypothetical protein K0S11_981, partial [Gammaproteobacteria bacterium]|nr:hypothetical protein [Gammaproteobacteria bacterium]